MKRRPIIAANWKMNITPSEAEKFVAAFLPLVKSNIEVDMVLCQIGGALGRVEFDRHVFSVTTKNRSRQRL